MLRDLRHALRLLIKHKGPTTAAVVALALGIGANAAVFSVVDAMMLRPLPFADLDRLVDLSQSRPQSGDVKLSVSPANFLDWRAQTKSYESVAAMAYWDVNLTGGWRPGARPGVSGLGELFSARSASHRPWAARSMTTRRRPGAIKSPS